MCWPFQRGNARFAFSPCGSARCSVAETWCRWQPSKHQGQLSLRLVILMPVNRRMRRPSVTDRLSARFESPVRPHKPTRLIVEALRHRVVPNHWSNLFGIVSASCIAVLFLTGIYLMFFYTPSSTIVQYNGAFTPLRGVEMSQALDSTLRITFELRAGLLMRQAHQDR